MMFSITLLGIIMCLQKVFPFKDQLNNVMEMLSLLYLLTLFVLAHFMPSDDLVINIIASCTMLQLFCIVLWHIKCLFLKNLSLPPIPTSVLELFIAKDNTKRQIELINTVPEVKYNYKEFQEPLIGQD